MLIKFHEEKLTNSKPNTSIEDTQSRHDQRILATEELVNDILSEDVSPIKNHLDMDGSDHPLSEEQKMQLLSFADSNYQNE